MFLNGTVVGTLLSTGLSTLIRTWGRLNRSMTRPHNKRIC
jgi:hypothetical protein